MIQYPAASTPIKRSPRINIFCGLAVCSCALPSCSFLIACCLPRRSFLALSSSALCFWSFSCDYFLFFAPSSRAFFSCSSFSLCNLFTPLSTVTSLQAQSQNNKAIELLTVARYIKGFERLEPDEMKVTSPVLRRERQVIALSYSEDRPKKMQVLEAN
jgi:hypothetical protein